MAKLLAYYNLCPINNVDEFLGLSKDAEPGCVINTLGRNIILVVKLSNQKQLCSWTALDRLTSKVVYDFKTEKYVGVFANRYIRYWSRSQDDINKVKRIKFHRNIVGLYSTPDGNTLVLYENGNCESLESALENRDTEKKSPQDPQLVISKVQIFKVLGEETLLTYFVRNEEENFTEFRYIILDKETLKPTQSIWKMKVHRAEQSVKLVGCTVVDGTPNPSLLSIWSDSRIFMESLKFDVSPNEMQSFNSIFVSMLNVINVEKPLSLIGIGKDIIAVYGNNNNQDGASLVLYNTHFKVFQAKQFFKVYFNNSKFWICENNILLACGQSLCVLPFRISKEQLADMIGSQLAENLNNVIDNESINEDCDFDDGYEYSGPLKIINFNELVHPKLAPTNLNHFVSSETFYDNLHELYKNNIAVDLVRDNKLPSDLVQMKLFSNVDNQLGPLEMSEHFEFFVSDLEKYGASEMEITEKLIPILLKTNSTLDMGKCLKRYNNISERMIVQVLKYVLEIPSKKSENVQNDKEMRDSNEQINFSKTEFPNRNIFLQHPTKEQLDLLNIVLSCSFNRDSVLSHLRKELTLTMVIELLTHLHELLVNEDDFLHEIPSNSEDFDNDEKVIEWATLLIDSHYQQLVLSGDDAVLEEIYQWQEIVDRHMKLVNELEELHPVIVNLLRNKNNDKEKKFSKWYSIETLKLY